MLLHLPSLFPWACLFLYLAKLTRDEIGAEDVNYVIIWAKTYCVMGREEKWQRPYMKKLNPMLGFWLRFWFLLCCQWPLVTSNVKVKSFISCLHLFKCAHVHLLYSHISGWVEGGLISRLKYGRQDSHPGNHLCERDCKMKWKGSYEP